MLTETKFVTKKLTNITTTYYTVPRTNTAIIRSISCVNTSGLSQGNLSLYLVPVGDDATDENVLFNDTPVRAIMQWSGYQVLAAGDTIQAKGNVTIHISGAILTWNIQTSNVDLTNRGT